MKIHENISLKPYNTFGIDQRATMLIEAENESDILEAIRLYPNLKVLGGGSNILLTQAPEVPLLHITQKGISVTKCTAFLEESDLVTEISHILRVFLYANNITTIKNVL